MECFSTPIGKRLAQCRTQQMQATTQEEADRFLAEEEGLIDAMLGRNRLEMYGQHQQSLREHYEMGLLDGQIMMSRQYGTRERPSILRALKQWLSTHIPFS